MTTRELGTVCRRHGEPLVMEELELDDPRDGDVLVRLKATSICGSNPLGL